MFCIIQVFSQWETTDGYINSQVKKNGESCTAVLCWVYTRLNYRGKVENAKLGEKFSLRLQIIVDLYPKVAEVWRGDRIPMLLLNQWRFSKSISIKIINYCNQIYFSILLFLVRYSPDSLWISRVESNRLILTDPVHNPKGKAPRMQLIWIQVPFVWHFIPYKTETGMKT